MGKKSKVVVQATAVPSENTYKEYLMCVLYVQRNLGQLNFDELNLNLEKLNSENIIKLQDKNIQGNISKIIDDVFAIENLSLEDQSKLYTIILNFYTDRIKKVAKFKLSAELTVIDTWIRNLVTLYVKFTNTNEESIKLLLTEWIEKFYAPNEATLYEIIKKNQNIKSENANILLVHTFGLLIMQYRTLLSLQVTKPNFDPELFIDSDLHKKLIFSVTKMNTVRNYPIFLTITDVCDISKPLRFLADKPENLSKGYLSKLHSRLLEYSETLEGILYPYKNNFLGSFDELERFAIGYSYLAENYKTLKNELKRKEILFEFNEFVESAFEGAQKSLDFSVKYPTLRVNDNNHLNAVESFKNEKIKWDNVHDLSASLLIYNISVLSKTNVSYKDIQKIKTTIKKKFTANLNYSKNFYYAIIQFYFFCEEHKKAHEMYIELLQKNITFKNPFIDTTDLELSTLVKATLAKAYFFSGNFKTAIQLFNDVFSEPNFREVCPDLTESNYNTLALIYLYCLHHEYKENYFEHIAKVNGLIPEILAKFMTTLYKKARQYKNDKLTFSEVFDIIKFSEEGEIILSKKDKEFFKDDEFSQFVEYVRDTFYYSGALVEDEDKLELKELSSDEASEEFEYEDDMDEDEVENYEDDVDEETVIEEPIQAELSKDEVEADNSQVENPVEVPRPKVVEVQDEAIVQEEQEVKPHRNKYKGKGKGKASVAEKSDTITPAPTLETPSTDKVEGYKGPYIIGGIFKAYLPKNLRPDLKKKAKTALKSGRFSSHTTRRVSGVHIKKKETDKKNPNEDAYLRLYGGNGVADVRIPGKLEEGNCLFFSSNVSDHNKRNRKKKGGPPVEKKNEKKKQQQKKQVRKK